MCSDFLVQHPNFPFFELSESEWEKAIIKYPSLKESSVIKYQSKTCSGSIIPGQDGYLDNAKILSQFERLFQMIEFKQEFNHPVKHDVEVVVDNATTHTALTVKLDDFR